MVNRWLVRLAVVAGMTTATATMRADSSKTTLMKELIADSMNKETLEGSEAFNKKNVMMAAVPAFLEYIQDHSDYRSYHLLFALRDGDPDVYARIPKRVKAAIICSMLKEQRYFDDWDEPYQKVGDPWHVPEAEQALIEIGRPAVRYLLPLLDDRSAAEWSEIEEPPAYEDYRRADYAFRYISWILGLPYDFQARPEDRDRALEALKAKLTAQKKPSLLTSCAVWLADCFPVVGEPPQLWTAIASNPEVDPATRRAAIIRLIDRHASPGMTLADLARLLDTPDWLEKEDFTNWNQVCMGGWIPVAICDNNSTFSFRVLLDLPGEVSAVFFRVSGTIDVEACWQLIQGQKSSRFSEAAILEVATFEGRDRCCRRKLKPLPRTRTAREIEAQAIFDHLQAWDREAIDIVECPDRHPHVADNGEVGGWIHCHLEQLRKLGFVASWNRTEKKYELLRLSR